MNDSIKRPGFVGTPAYQMWATKTPLVNDVSTGGTNPPRVILTCTIKDSAEDETPGTLAGSPRLLNRLRGAIRLRH